MDIVKGELGDGGSVRHLLEGPIEQRLRATLAAVSQAEADVGDGRIVDLGPLARSIAVLAADIQALPADEGTRLTAMVSVLSDGLGSLASGLTERVRTSAPSQ